MPVLKENTEGLPLVAKRERVIQTRDRLLLLVAGVPQVDFFLSDGRIFHDKKDPQGAKDQVGVRPEHKQDQHHLGDRVLHLTCLDK